jgi:hypothetical protein
LAGKMGVTKSTWTALVVTNSGTRQAFARWLESRVGKDLVGVPTHPRSPRTASATRDVSPPPGSASPRAPTPAADAAGQVVRGQVVTCVVVGKHISKNSGRAVWDLVVDGRGLETKGAICPGTVVPPRLQAGSRIRCEVCGAMPGNHSYRPVVAAEAPPADPSSPS